MEPEPTVPDKPLIETIYDRVREHLRPRTEDQMRAVGKKQRTDSGDVSDNPELDLELGILHERGIYCCGSYTLNDTCPKCYAPLRRRA